MSAWVAGVSGRTGTPWLIILAALAAAVTAVPIAQAGVQWVLVSLAVVCFAAILAVTRDRALLTLVVLVLSLQFLFHKSLGAINEDIHSGANAIFVNNIDVLLVVLYGFWIGSGSFRADVAAALRRREVVIPLLGSLAVVPSIIVATDLQLTVAELLRMAWMFLLFLYVAVRVRTRRDVVMLLVAFFAIGVAQAVIAALQWRTGSSLGLSFLGEESSLGIRTLDDGDVPRPTGTVVHPIFLAALVAPIGLIAISLAIVLRVRRWRIASGVMAAVAFTPLVLAQARASLLAAGITVTLLVVVMLRARQLALKPVLIALVIAAAIGLVFLEPIQEKFANNLGTSQFQLEIESRLELNDVAFAMIRESPVVGLGLNQFETVQPRYDEYGLLFAGNPVHNIYLLVAAETGIIGLAGFLAIYGTAIVMALRSARAKDPLFVGVGVGIIAALTFFGLEELLSFALRQEMPLTLFWILTGLAVACARMVGEAGNAPLREVSTGAF
jgi:O-antigen ligase